MRKTLAVLVLTSFIVFGLAVVVRHGQAQVSSPSIGGETPVIGLGVDLIPHAQQVLNITGATTTVLKSGYGRIARVSVIVAGSTAGAVYDNNLVTGNSAANQVFVIPNVVGMYQIDFPCQTGIAITTGTGQAVAVAFY